MINYIKGDLFSTDADVIAHGCNCAGGFGSGIAGIIKAKYPKARHYYLDKFLTEGWKLGDIQFVTQWDGKIIANCATQEEYLPRGIVHVDYNAIDEVMKKLYYHCKEYQLSVSIPKIGSGLAGGSWNKIEAIINNVFDDYPITCYYID